MASSSGMGIPQYPSVQPLSQILGPNGAPLTLQASTNMGRMNRNWWHWSPSPIGYAWDPDSVGVETYELMMATDDTCFSAISFKIMAILSHLGSYVNDDKEKQSFVRDNFAAMPGDVKFFAAEIMTAMWAGYSVSELLWRPEGGKVWLDKVETLWPRSIFFMIGTQDSAPAQKNELVHILQWPFTGYQVDIPRSKTCLYSHKAQFGNFYGRSALKPAFKWWFIKDKITLQWPRTVEKYGTPWMSASVADGTQTMTHPVTGVSTLKRDYVAELLDAFAEGTNFTHDESTTFAIHQLARECGSDFEALIEACDKRIYRANLMPSLMADHGKNGSRALGGTQENLFNLTLDEGLDEIALTIIQEVVRPLIEINFGKQSDYGKFRTFPFKARDARLLVQTFCDLTDHGYLSPERKADMDQVRDEVGFLPVDEDNETWPELERLPRQEAQRTTQTRDLTEENRDKEGISKEVQALENPATVATHSATRNGKQSLRRALLKGVPLHHRGSPYSFEE